MATTEQQRRWIGRKMAGLIVPCQQCGGKNNNNLCEAFELCLKCWLKTPEGKAYNQEKVARSIANKFDRAAEAKHISIKFSAELGFVNRAALQESVEKNTLEVIEGVGFVHFHHRRDKQTTVYSLAVLPDRQKEGWGRLLFYRVLCSAIENGCDRIVAKCPEDLAANTFYQQIGFVLAKTEPGKKRRLNSWEYRIQLPLLFYCGGGGQSQHDRTALEEGWLLGLRSNGRNKDHWHMAMVDNEWGEAYRHEQHLAMVRRNKPLIATVKDIEAIEQLPEALKQARELAQYCGRVILIPKVKTWLPSKYWLGYSVPTGYGGTDIECGWFGDRFVHILGGSPDDQANFAKHLNVVSLDANYAMALADFGKSAWQGCSRGVKVAEGCYPAMRMSFQKQKQFWHTDQLLPWANDPLFSGRCV
jgi:GNAT superfamily N-acetyltransferase